MKPNLKRKLSKYFQTKQTSETAVKLMEMFILPFLKYWNPLASVDDAVMAFFAAEDRMICYGTAKRGFRMPGEVALAGAKYSKMAKERDVKRGQKMLVVFDRIDQTAKVDINLNGKDYTFRLLKAEVDLFNEVVDLVEA